MAVSLDDKYTLANGRAYMSGIEALVKLPMLQRQRDLAAGLNTAGYISGYRGSPLGGFDFALSKAQSHLKQHHIHFQPGVNEELAATSIWGSQQVNLFEGAKYDGVFGLWYGKGPGLDRAMDAIKHGNNTGASRLGGVLAVVGDDHLCKSSTLAFQSEPMFAAATMPVLNPASIQDVLDFGLLGWAMSRYSGCWVGLKTTAANMDANVSTDVDPDRVNIVIPQDFDLPEGGLNSRWPDPPLAQEARLQRSKIYAALAFARANNIDRVAISHPKRQLGIVTTGKAYLDTMQALSDLGIDEGLAADIGLGVYKVGMSWPLEPQGAKAFAQGFDELLVIEEKRSLIEDQLKGQLYMLPDGERPRIVGEYDEAGALLVSNVGGLNPGDIAQVIVQRLLCLPDAAEWRERLLLSNGIATALPAPGTLPQRQPWFCSGCPHNTSTRVPEGSRALAGIGCHFMATWMDRQTDTFTQMGGEGSSWIGQAPFTETAHVFQNLGDGTYFHSGILAIRAAIASGVNITYKILYNDAVAMTGGQNLDGSLSVEQMIQQLQGEGITRIALVSDLPEKYKRGLASGGLSVDHRDRLDAIQRELRELPGTTVIIYEQTCATEKRRRRKRGLLEDPDKRVFINERVCEGCGDCGVQSNCLSVIPKETALGRKRAIDQNSCNKDYSCVKGFCPSFVTVHGSALRKKDPNATSGVSDIQFPPLPEPQVPALTQPYSILLPGVGGMGVLTVGSVIGMAAHLEGLGTAVITQTGLAQKFGAVTSHVRIAPRQQDIHAYQISEGVGDLLLGADLVVASARDSLALMHAGAGAVVNSHDSPTAEFTHNPDAAFPGREMEAAITNALHDVNSGSESQSGSHFVDATGLATALMGDAIASNFLLLGYAWQLGLLPLRLESLEQAVRLNAVAVELNLNALQWGRRYAECPDKVRQAAGIQEVDYDPPMPSLDDLVSERERWLTQYQNAAYAERYRVLVDQVRSVDIALHGSAGELSEAVIRNYYKLLAYKDEYEVARLYSDGEFIQQLEQQFESGYRLSFHLAPPLLAKRDKDNGRLLKQEFGAWMLPAFRLLAKLKFLRGTRLDPFSYTDERKMERQLVDDYVAGIEQLLESLAADSSTDAYALAVKIAALPEFIRGYGHVKEANVVSVRRRRAALWQQLLNPDQRGSNNDDGGEDFDGSVNNYANDVGNPVQIVNIQEPLAPTPD
ncbi:MAG: indolepyruvate ferredoxin oxidoreductase family protein [Porticoccaceae bacterium]|nr:indolepyruvate ferredoxin oxidoreductase family protein [Porticoccaceae bacterium]